MHRVELLARWLAVGGDRASGHMLLDRYDEAHRGYHNARHLSEVLHAIDALSRGVDGRPTDGDRPTDGNQLARPAVGRPASSFSPAAVVLGAFWHDAVYDPRRGDNEEQSALLAEPVLRRLDLPERTVRQVVALVRLTATHDPSPGDLDGAVLCDADLAILAAGPRRYRDYVVGVRREYAHLDDPAFAAGRADVLRALLARPALYRTATGHRHWEDAARANVRAELITLAPTRAQGDLADG